MSLNNPMTRHRLRLAYQRPKEDRLRRIAVVKPRNNDIFISYAAQDGEFVRCLDKAIRDQGFDPWIDFDDIPNFKQLSDNEHYKQHIKNGILGADVFVLVLSDAALACQKTTEELRLAQRLNKLIVLLSKDVSNEFERLKDEFYDLQYLECVSPVIEQAFEQVARNIIHLQTYIRLLARAKEWDRQGRPNQYLLTPEDLKEVKKQKQWIETHKLGEQFKFTDLQKVFLKTVNTAHETSEYFRKSPPDIFMSYARSNQKFVERLNKALKKDRWRVWIDRDRIPVAANWRTEAEEGIRYAHTVIFVICSDSLISNNCRWEFEKAREYNKRIIPVISHSAYDRDVFYSMGLQSVQYVSFVRKNQSFEKSLTRLLDALKENLDDLKTYRRLLLKAYEWSESDRLDTLLMSRHEYKGIENWCKQRQNIQKNDNRELEPLLSRQKEYIRASQRYLALQRKRQSLFLSATVGIVSGLSFLLLTTTFSEIRALVRSLDDLNGLDALVTGLQAGQRVQRHAFFIDLLGSRLDVRATTALHRTALELREVNRFEEHSGKVFSAVFSADGQQLVSVGRDKTVRFWNLSDYETTETKQKDISSCPAAEKRNIGFHGDPIITVDYSSDQEYVATGDIEGFVKIWTCAGQLYKTLPKRHQFLDSDDKIQGARVSRVSFSPGGYYLASAGTDSQIFLWTRGDNFTNPIKLEHPIQPENSKRPEITAMAFSPNGKYLASADSQGHVYWWELKHQPNKPPSVELLDVFQYNAPEGPLPPHLTTVTFSPNSSLLAFTGLRAAIQVHDLRQETGRLLTGHDGFVYSLLFSSDGKTLASASADATVKLWNPRNEQGKELVHTLRGHQGPVYRLAFGPQDDVLATGGKDGIIRLWLREKGIQIDSFEGHKDEISSLAFAPKPSLGYTTPILASASDDGSIRLWNLDNPIQRLPHNNNVFDVAFGNEGRVIASGGIFTVKLWRPDGTSKSDIEFAKNVKVWAVDYSPNGGEILAAGGSNGQIKLWKPDIDTQAPFQSLDAHAALEDSEILEQGVLDLSFNHDGQWLASVGTDKTLKLWRVSSEGLYRYITLPHPNDVTAVGFSPNNQFLVTGTRARSTSDKRGLFLWKITQQSMDNKRIVLSKTESPLKKHEGSILSIAIQPKGKSLIASGGEDATINLWEPSGKWLRTLRGHGDAITQVSFSADGEFLASSSKDGTIRLWTAQGELISMLERHNRSVSSVEFGPKSNNILASSSASEDVLIWDLWKLPTSELTDQNQKSVILDVLMSDGCATILPFLENYYPSSDPAKANKKNTDKTIRSKKPITASNEDKDWLKDIEKLKDFCSRSSILPKVIR